MSDAKATILVVDDLPANRDLMVRRLERSGFQVQAAGSGPEALELVRRGNVDMVLLDIMMPGMTGIDVLRTLRATRSWPPVSRSWRWGPSSRRSGCRRWRAPTRCCFG